jgi:hypothetical protein
VTTDPDEQLVLLRELLYAEAAAEDHGWSDIPTLQRYGRARLAYDQAAGLTLDQRMGRA